jgi:hypothetical protein
VRWLHIPKCGSTLILTVLGHACEREMAPWRLVQATLAGGSIDLRVARELGVRGRGTGVACGGRLMLPFTGHRVLQPKDHHVVAMFRRPAQRLISAFLDNWHAIGIGRFTNRSQMKLAAPTVDLWARFDGVAGCQARASHRMCSFRVYCDLRVCQAKMLAGYFCGHRLRIRQKAVLARALRALRSPQFAFVGLVEHWRASVCLFHQTVGGGRSAPLAAEFLRLGHHHEDSAHRRTNRLTSRAIGGCVLRSSRGGCYENRTAGGMYDERALEGFVDELDEAVYAAAEALFRTRVAQHGLESMLSTRTSARDAAVVTPARWAESDSVLARAEA